MIDLVLKLLKMRFRSWGQFFFLNLKFVKSTAIDTAHHFTSRFVFFLLMFLHDLQWVQNLSLVKMKDTKILEQQNFFFYEIRRGKRRNLKFELDFRKLIKGWSQSAVKYFFFCRKECKTYSICRVQIYLVFFMVIFICHFFHKLTEMSVNLLFVVLMHNIKSYWISCILFSLLECVTRMNLDETEICFLVFIIYYYPIWQLLICWFLFFTWFWFLLKNICIFIFHQP